LDKSNAILFSKFSGLGFEIGNWKLYGKYELWRREEWEVPKLRRYDELRKCFYSVNYSDNLSNHSLQKISDKEANKLFEDGLHGYISLENFLAKNCF
jgi:hypothetical protein